MDFIVADDDNRVSLEEALAFIDACAVTQSELPTNVIDTSNFFHSSPLDLLDQLSYSELLNTKVSVTPNKKRAAAPPPHKQQRIQEEEPKKKRRARSANSSSTRPQQRKKAEIQALGEQAQELETQVDLLKKKKFLPGDVVLELEVDMNEKEDGVLVAKDAGQKPPSSWHEMAITQYKERLLSEKTNRRLKSILSNQMKVNGALNGLLQKGSVLHSMDYVISTQPALENSLLSTESPVGPPSTDGADSSNEVITELGNAVQRLYQEFKNIIEFVTTTPMTCSVDEASEILWKELTTYREHPDKVYKYMRGYKPNSQEKSFILTLRSPSGMLELNGLQFMQRFEEMDLTPSDAGSNTSLVEIFLQLYMERDDGLEASPDDIAYAQNIVMGSLSNTFRKTFQVQQNALMEKAGRVVVSSS
ncbi:hypothetical protein BBJ29_009044 [Phytophthora kernoviae]|uniref:Uncharacterized protein n=1 Tax=Phytophthora kernoviae TaxID=325452 RepID=A0A3F2RIH7_9STRA|nr:hypothetical protein BBJ29_009044 [Phytophthora kernoviae]RLN57641.1 hypothetical protein BBP00_00007405 [Phytophthora kernoviae]